VTVDVEIICIGNELLIGKIENTNAYWLAKQITAIGASVRRITVVQDIVEEIAASINEAVARKPQFIITTGGLGPTFDDKTFQGIAKALNQKLVVNADAFEMVKQKCIEWAEKRRMPAEIEMTPPRVKMAVFPENTEPITNPIGTAPGLQVHVEGVALFALPGVPREMEAIFTQTIVPLIKKSVGAGIFCELSIFIDDIFESRLAPLIDLVMDDNPDIYIKSHALRTERGLELHLTSFSDENKNCSGALEKAAKELTVLIKANGGVVYT